MMIIEMVGDDWWWARSFVFFFSICEISTHVHFGDPTSLIKMFFLVTNKPQVAAACWSFEASWWKGQIATIQVRQENLDSEAHPNDLTRWNIWLSGKSKRNDWVLPEDDFLKNKFHPRKRHSFVPDCSTAKVSAWQHFIWYSSFINIINHLFEEYKQRIILYHNKIKSILS